MREILFKGKRLDNGEWVYGSLVSLDNKGKAILKSKSAVYMPNGKNTISSTDCYEVDPVTVGQYTGFKDKNGNKIFEGDILGGKCKGEIIIHIVTFFNGQFIFPKEMSEVGIVGNRLDDVTEESVDTIWKKLKGEIRG